MKINHYDYKEVQELVLKIMIHKPNDIPYVSQMITSEDFDNIRYKKIFESLNRISALNQKPTLSNVFNDLIKHKMVLQENELYLFSNPPKESPSSLIETLKYYSTKNQVNNIIKETEENIKTEDLESSLTYLKDNVIKILDNFQKKEEINFSDRVLELKNKILNCEIGNEDKVPSFYPSLDKYTGGWGKGQLITIGARTGVGKTVFAVNSAVAAAQNNKNVLFFSLEMTLEELTTRMSAMYGDLLLRKLFHPTKEEMQDKDLQNKIKETFDNLSKLPITIDDTAEVTVEYIRSKATQLHKEGKVDLIIVDYLQLIKPMGNKKGTRQEEVAELSRAMKLLAKTLKVPVMVLVQLNRETKDESEDRLPSKADIKESSAIAADSDIIIIIHRKYRDDSTQKKALFILDKHRGGIDNKIITVRCILESSKFEDMGEPNNPSPQIENNEENNDFIDDDDFDEMDKYIDTDF